jgi:glucose-6-phosphate isomerase
MLALRMPRERSLVVDGRDVVKDVHAVLDRMARVLRARRSRRVARLHRQADPNVVNIGIGGSDLGPVMAYEALRALQPARLTFRFVSNVDGTDIAEATATWTPRRRCSSSPRRRSPRSRR